MESAGGVGMVGISRVDGRSGFSLEDLSRIAEDVYEPSVLAVGTRDGYESSFRKAFSHFLSFNKVADLLPASLRDLKRILTEMSLDGESYASLRSTLSSVVQLHTRNEYPSPVSAEGGFRKLLKPFEIVQGNPQKVITPLTSEHYKKLLEVTVDNMVTRRAVLVTAFGTAIAGRNEHVYRRTVCDVQVDFDMERSEVRVGAQPFRFPLRNKIECAEATQRVSQQDLWFASFRSGWRSSI